MNIITSTGNKPYNEFFTEALDYMEKYDIKGIALIILTDNDDQMLSGYWSMNLIDKQVAKSQIELDIIDEFIKNNSDRYGLDLADEDQD